MENYKFKKYIQIFQSIYKNGKNYKIWWYWNRKTKVSEPEHIKKTSEPAEHIKRNIDHVFNWKILCPASSQKHLMKNLEAIFIALYKPSLNDKRSFDRLMLFRKV